MSALKIIIEEAAAMSDQNITHFLVGGACGHAVKVIEQRRRLVLNEEFWNLVMGAISNPPTPNDKLKRAADCLKSMGEFAHG